MASSGVQSSQSKRNGSVIKLEMVWWRDHYSSQGWQDPPTSAEHYVATSVGFPVFEDKDYVVLAQTVAPWAVADLMHILKSDIVKRKKINANGTGRSQKKTGRTPLKHGVSDAESESNEQQYPKTLQ